MYIYPYDIPLNPTRKCCLNSLRHLRPSFSAWPASCRAQDQTRSWNPPMGGKTQTRGYGSKNHDICMIMRSHHTFQLNIVQLLMSRSHQPSRQSPGRPFLTCPWRNGETSKAARPFWSESNAPKAACSFNYTTYIYIYIYNYIHSHIYIFW